MGNMGFWQLVIILVIVVLLFGTKRLKGIGSDLGGAIKGFKKAVTDEEKDADFSSQKKVENTAENSATTSAPQSEVKDKS
ncbi:twin-arginine translocase TatA/TatE family subunit [Alteromonas sp. KUL49]|uniref:twin-arginine translocase TatA/TatE family subunit n=1 Tax=Alteromonas sp. KUL49 TaxID=2480798 RepID=UPI00102F14E5|nr:twin-arginine translocase TatA/TatE family subunit [Alteromonas sp. KUL49]TAP42568.1 twin-arginine translocase TatA/TatE family subunit [Alteromonas sp. KUL49]GEA10203.1 Sec-independent protein translocase protein TatA [Alteromonas sp. KUL49]